MATKADETPPPIPPAAALETSDPLRDPAPHLEIPAAAAEAEAAAAAAEEEEEEEEPRESKRRRTCPAALEALPSAAEWEDGGSVGGDGDGDEAISFSFEARSFVPIETTPKFGSFNCAAVLGAPPPPEEEEEAEAAAAAAADDGVGVEGKDEKGGAEGKTGISQGKEG